MIASVQSPGAGPGVVGFRRHALPRPRRNAPAIASLAGSLRRRRVGKVAGCPLHHVRPRRRARPLPVPASLGRCQSLSVHASLFEVARLAGIQTREIAKTGEEFHEELEVTPFTEEPAHAVSLLPGASVAAGPAGAARAASKTVHRIAAMGGWWSPGTCGR